MEKIINIDGKDVRFKSTAVLPLRYKAQFGRDMFADVVAIQDSWDEEKQQFTGRLDLELVYNVVWCMAKSANPEIEPPFEWYDQFEEGLPIFDAFGQLSEMLMKSIMGTQKN